MGTDIQKAFSIALPDGYMAENIFCMKKGTCLFVTAKDGQGNRKTFSCGACEGFEACLGQAEENRNGDDEEERDSFKEMCLPPGTYFVKIVGYVVSLYGIDQRGNLWVWYFYEE